MAILKLAAYGVTFVPPMLLLLLARSDRLFVRGVMDARKIVAGLVFADGAMFIALYWLPPFQWRPLLQVGQFVVMLSIAVANRKRLWLMARLGDGYYKWNEHDLLRLIRYMQARLPKGRVQEATAPKAYRLELTTVGADLSCLLYLGKYSGRHKLKVSLPNRYEGSRSVIQAIVDIRATDLKPMVTARHDELYLKLG